MKKKIAIFQTDLEVGGIQKSLVNLLNHLDYKKVDVDLYIDKLKDSFYGGGLSKKVNVKRLYRLPRIIELNTFQLARGLYFNKLKNTYTQKHYDVSIDFNSYNHSCSLGALAVNATRRIIWIHNDVKIKVQEEFKYKLIWHSMKSKYKYFDKYCAVSGGIVDSFSSKIGLDKLSIVVIPNIIDVEDILTKKDELTDINIEKNKYNLVFVGRMCHQKGVDILLKLFKDVFQEDNKYHLYLIGNGPLFRKYRLLAEKLGLKAHVTFLGNQKNPYKYMNLMDACILTSRYEGQGMVLREAQVLGLKILIPKHLEKYNTGITSQENLKEAILSARKCYKQYNSLSEYNNMILKKIYEL